MTVERLAQEGQRVLPTGIADRVGQVDDEDRRQPIDRQDEPEPGQGEDERRQQHRPNDERDPPATGPDPPARAQVQADRDRPAAGISRSSASGASKADAHQAARLGAAPPRRAAERAPHADETVTVVQGPLDAQRDQDEQHDRDPQLVAGRRPTAAAGGPGRRWLRAPVTRRPGRSERLDASPADPGAIVDSSTSKRSTTNRTGAIGSSSDGRRGAAGAELAARARCWRAARPTSTAPRHAPTVPAGASGSGIGVTV